MGEEEEKKVEEKTVSGKLEIDNSKPEEKENLKEDLQKVEQEAYKRRKEELDEIEKRVDKKTADLKEIIDEANKSGKGLMMKPEPPKKLSDTEYAEALQRGEVNPLKEDGLI